MRQAVRALVIGALVAGVSGCWPVPGQNPDRTGFNDRETAITPATVGGLHERWTWASGGGHVRSPVVSSGGVHVVVGCTLATIDRRAGTERWSVDLAPSWDAAQFPCASDMRWTGDPFVSGDVVLAGTVFRFDGRPPPTPVTPFYEAVTTAWDVRTGAPDPIGLDVQGALEARRGDVVGGRNGEGGFTGTPPLLTPYLNVFPVLGPLGGALRRLPVSGTAPMTIGPAAAYVATGATLRAFAVSDPPTGCGTGGTGECPLWEATLDGALVGHPVVGAGGATVHVATDAGTVYALDAATGAVSWQAAVGSAATEAPALAHGTLYVPTAAGALVAVPAGGCGAATCAPAWSTAAGSRITEQPVVGGDVVLTGAADGALRAHDAAGCGAPTCPALWSASAGSEVTGLSVSAGVVYAGTASGRLVAYGL